MAAGCSIVASNTAPVTEFLENGSSALLVDFFDIDEQATAINRILDDFSLSSDCSAAAMKCVRRVSVTNALAHWEELFKA